MVFAPLSSTCSVEAQTTVNNSDLVPRVLQDSQVQMEGASPDWVKTLIMAEVRIETATPEGTFATATKVLDHYAEMGVNGLWVDPIYGRDNPLRNGYGNFGPQTIYPALTGTSNIDSSFEQLKRFVDEAHRRNIRILLDIIVWGTPKNSPLFISHPEFYTKKNGKFVNAWGGYQFDWTSEALRRWYKDSAVSLIERTGADGFRVDLAPDTSGYFFKEIRDTLYAEGHKIIIVSEISNTRRDVFDFEQVGVSGRTEEPDYAHPIHRAEQSRVFGKHYNYLLNHNIVDAIQSGRGVGSPTMQQAGDGGTFRFYTSNLLDHDDDEAAANGNRVRFAYATIFAPYIPIWWIGEEWNNPYRPGSGGGGVMYFNHIDWNEIRSNQAFYKDVKRYIRIRRSYPEIFQYFSENARNANIAKVDTFKSGAPNNLQAYARFASGKAVLIVPNYKGSGNAIVQIKPDYTSLGLDRSSFYKIVDLMTGQLLTSQTDQLSRDKSFSVRIASDHLGIYLMERK